MHVCVCERDKVVRELTIVEADHGYVRVHYTILSILYMFEIFIIEVKERRKKERKKERRKEGRKERRKEGVG